MYGALPLVATPMSREDWNQPRNWSPPSSAAAVRAGEALGQQLGGVHLEPCVGALFAEDVGNGLYRIVRADGLAAVGAVEDRDGQAPAALTGDAPVGTLADHGDHAVMAPLGQPLHVVAGGAGLVLEGVDGAEPLVGGAVEYRALAAPAVGVLVDDVLGGVQRAARLKVIEDGLVGLVGGEAAVLAGLLVHEAVVVDGDGHADVDLALGVVLAADLIVLLAVAGSGVDAAGAGVERDVVAQDDDALAVDERVLGGHELELAALHLGEDLEALIAAHLGDAAHELLGDDVDLAVGGLGEDVVEVRVQADGEVAGDGPGGSSPDDEIELVEVAVLTQLAVVVLDLELDIDGLAGVLGVLDLGLGQSGLVVRAPVDGLLALVDVALLVHLAEDLDLLGLELRVHGEVGLVPLAQAAEALEGVALDVDVVQRELVAGGAELGGGHFLVVELLLFYDGALDGHAVVVPAGVVDGLPAGHGLIAGDEVLEALVERGAHVDGAVGERRAVVQVEDGPALGALEHLVVEVHVVPLLEHIGFALGQRGAHGELGFRQIDRGIVVLSHFCFSLLMLKLDV